MSTPSRYSYWSLQRVLGNQTSQERPVPRSWCLCGLCWTEKARSGFFRSLTGWERRDLSKRTTSKARSQPRGSWRTGPSRLSRSRSSGVFTSRMLILNISSTGKSNLLSRRWNSATEYGATARACVVRQLEKTDILSSEMSILTCQKGESAAKLILSRNLLQNI